MGGQQTLPSSPRAYSNAYEEARQGRTQQEDAEKLNLTSYRELAIICISLPHQLAIQQLPEIQLSLLPHPSQYMEAAQENRPWWYERSNPRDSCPKPLRPTEMSSWAQRLFSVNIARLDHILENSTEDPQTRTMTTFTWKSNHSPLMIEEEQTICWIEICQQAWVYFSFFSVSRGTQELGLACFRSNVTKTMKYKGLCCSITPESPSQQTMFTVVRIQRGDRQCDALNSEMLRKNEQGILGHCAYSDVPTKALFL
ncbi:hypothetical protein U0070_018515 [Myodes glareolus]|uniref:Uncharacterized protein n=1 Tax=Myodes glareolus TaxID=447135 RepID=A0AAW0JXH2_MYOGA